MGIKILNSAFERQIEKNKNAKTIIHLLYSKAEHTYEDHVIHLIKKLDECHIMHMDYIENFSNHSMVGDYMKLLCAKFN